MHCTRLCTPYASPITSAHCALSFETLAAVRSTTLRSRPFVKYGQRCQFSWRQPGQRQRLKPYAYSYRTQEAQLKPDCRTEGRRIGSRETLGYTFLITSLYYTCTFPCTSLAYCTFHFSRIPSLLLLIFQIHKLLHSWGARHVFAHCVSAVHIVKSSPVNGMVWYSTYTLTGPGASHPQVQSSCEEPLTEALRVPSTRPKYLFRDRSVGCILPLFMGVRAPWTTDTVIDGFSGASCSSCGVPLCMERMKPANTTNTHSQENARYPQVQWR